MESLSKAEELHLLGAWGVGMGTYSSRGAGGANDRGMNQYGPQKEVKNANRKVELV